MSKIEGKLSYKDWCILKHALRDRIDEKAFRLRSDEYLLNRGCRDITLENINKIKKELEEEKRTLERVVDIIDQFKKKIED